MALLACSLNASSLRLLLYMLFTFQVQLPIINDHLTT